MTIYNQESYVILQLFGLCMIAIAIAFPIYHFVRKSSPELGWNYHGNIPTSHFERLDILGVIIASILFVSNTLIMPFIDVEALMAANETSPLATIISGIVTQLFPVGVIALFVCFRCNIFEIFGLRRPDWKRIAIVVGLGILAILLLANLAGVVAEPWLKRTFGEQNPQEAVKMMLEAKANNPKLLIGLAFLACIVAPICEEILFRGYLYGILKRYSCRFFAAIMSGLIFGVIHGSMWSLAPLVVIGILLAVIYEVSGSLWASIICHSLFNSMSTFYMIFILDANSLPY